MTSSNRIWGDSYVPKYSQDYYTLPWYKSDLVAYIDWLRYNEMSDNPDEYFNKKKVINSDIIHHECRGDSLKKSYLEHKAVKKSGFNECPEDEKTKTVSSVIRNIKRDDLWVQRNLMIEHLKKYF